MSIVLTAIEHAGLGDVLAARRAHDAAALAAAIPRLEACDLMVLGALADLVRKEEVGDDVRIFANVDGSGEGVTVFGAEERGLTLLRKVAIARVTKARAARIRVDWGKTGLEIAQVALGFGASELEGPIANKRGLPIAEDAVKKVKGQGMVAVQALAKKELAGLLRRAGREPIFEGEAARGPSDVEAEVHP